MDGRKRAMKTTRKCKARLQKVKIHHFPTNENDPGEPPLKQKNTKRWRRVPQKCMLEMLPFKSDSAQAEGAKLPVG